MEGLAGLGINLPTLVAQIVNFIILFGLLYLVAYKPIMRMLDERSRRVKESMEQTEYIKEQAGKEGEKVIAQAAKAGEDLRQKAEQQAKGDAEALVARARSEIQRERNDAVDELRREFADLTIKAAEKVIDRSLDKKAHRELIDEVLKEGKTLKKK